MTEVTTYRQPGKLEQLQAQVLTPERKAQLFETLPSHVKPERFERNLYFTMTQVRDIDHCTPDDIFNQVMKIAALGLYLDPQLGEAYLIVGRGYKIQARVGYRGLIKLARQSGDITEFYAHEVYAEEHAQGLFHVRLGDDKRVDHEPIVVGERGEWIGAYAVVKFSSGGTDKDFEWMPKPDIFKIRDRSDAYQAFKRGDIKSTPWDTDEIEMAKKTVIRRLAKRLPQSPELAEALALEDRAEGYQAGEEPEQRASLADRFRSKSSNAGFHPDNVARLGNGQQIPIDTNGRQAEEIPSSTTSSDSQVGDDASSGADRPPGDRPTADVLEAYSTALGKMTAAASVGKADAAYWKTAPAVSELDVPTFKRIFDVHINRVEGHIEAEEARTNIARIIAEATKL